jgi:GH15 family glucan-1,4-alpha-glucosidase
MYTPIKDYFLIGDLHTAALVSSRGSIDWLCLPYFDSPSVFASMLDAQKGGSFHIDMPDYAADASYVPKTAIVQTTFVSPHAEFEVRDFMLPRPTEEVVPHYLVRKFVGIKGTTTVKCTFDPRPNYAKQKMHFTQEGNRYYARIDDHTLWLHVPKTGARVTIHRDSLEIDIDIQEGEVKEMVLEYSVATRLYLQKRDLEEETTTFWKDWLSKGTFFDYARDYLVRSAITLKLMQFYPTGGLVAAPTASLPEEIGGVRNWDYRYVWMRDATFTLYAFYVLGFTEEAAKFFRFMEMIADHAKTCVDDICDIDLSIMYTIWGQPLQGESTLDDLSGYRDSKPVRIGNGAAHQFQLDMYGSLIDAYYFMSKKGVAVGPNEAQIIRMLVRAIAANWKREDSGIWEVRGGDQHFAYSKLMAWMGVERALRLADVLNLSTAEHENWSSLAQEIETYIWDNLWDESAQTFKQHTNTHAQDASNFTFVLFNFLSRHDPRASAMIDATRKELSKDELYVYRYLNEDGLEGGEGAFVFCMFWQIAALAAVGKSHEAEKLLQRIEAFIPKSGLMAEEIDPKTGEYLGNHPQAFSHIGYILAAYYIYRYGKKGTAETLSIAPR